MTVRAFRTGWLILPWLPTRLEGGDMQENSGYTSGVSNHGEIVVAGTTTGAPIGRKASPT